MAKQLVLLTYTPRELSEEEYAKFIREIDYPAFRQNAHIIDYSCWRVADSVQGREEFTHFDLMAVDDLANWQAIVSDWPVASDVLLKIVVSPVRPPSDSRRAPDERRPGLLRAKPWSSAVVSRCKSPVPPCATP